MSDNNDAAKPAQAMGEEIREYDFTKPMTAVKRFRLFNEMLADAQAALGKPRYMQIYIVNGQKHYSFNGNAVAVPPDEAKENENR